MIERTNNPSLPQECVDSVLWMKRSRVAQEKFEKCSGNQRNELYTASVLQFAEFVFGGKAMLKTTQYCSCDKNIHGGNILISSFIRHA